MRNYSIWGVSRRRLLQAFFRRRGCLSFHPDSSSGGRGNPAGRNKTFTICLFTVLRLFLLQCFLCTFYSPCFTCSLFIFWTFKVCSQFTLCSVPPFYVHRLFPFHRLFLVYRLSLVHRLPPVYCFSLPPRLLPLRYLFPINLIPCSSAVACFSSVPSSNIYSCFNICSQLKACSLFICSHDRIPLSYCQRRNNGYAGNSRLKDTFQEYFCRYLPSQWSHTEVTLASSLARRYTATQRQSSSRSSSEIPDGETKIQKSSSCQYSVTKYLLFFLETDGEADTGR